MSNPVIDFSQQHFSSVCDQ